MAPSNPRTAPDNTEEGADDMPNEKTDKTAGVLIALNAWSDAVAKAATAHEASTAQVVAPLPVLPKRRSKADCADAITLLTAHVLELDQLYLVLARRATQESDPGRLDLLMRLALKCQSAAVRSIQTMALTRGPVPALAPDDGTTAR
jgi:hypothetical protein